MKFKKYFLIIAASCFFTTAFAYTQPTDTIVAQTDDSEQIESDLDSLLSLWYVKNSIVSTNNNVSEKTVDAKEIPDSVYIERLNAIPSLMELPYNQIIRKYIELYSNRKSAHILIGLSDYYFPIFEQILDQYELPLELKYLPIIESALNPRAVSRAGATGLWQFMFGTGRMYQLEINSFVDERRDPVKSSYAAAKFLSHLYGVYKDWTLVIAAYNCGPGNVNKAIRRANGKRDYWDIYPYLPRETRGYVPAFIGAAYMMNYYEEHNITPTHIKMPMMTDTVMIDNKLHLQQVAEVLKMSIEELRDLNPQYKKDIIPATGQDYPLRLPLEYSMAFLDLQDSIYAYRDTFFFNPKNTIITPAKYNKKNYYSASNYKSTYTPPSTKNMTKLTYTVKEGDNLGFISDWYDVSIADLQYWNNIKRNTIRIGQNLSVYVPNKKAYKYKKINTSDFNQKNTVAYKSTSTKSAANSDFKYDAKYIYYRIKKGENLWTIAKKYPGISNTDLMKINNFTESDVRVLKAGQVIKIKEKS
ncbi:MAG: transglycosylase SLT domain-containing protein [Bacteroidales bacterium]|nr:transglycosylase SLT domain-containing protein [Bacteroidales bacterium]MBN2757077.1 transglycosylase SLT domain-containing protein [Bacteroidales bacterium]